MPKLRAVIATPLPEALCHLIARLEPRLDLVWEQSLLPPERWPADYTGDPAWRRSPDEQARFEAMVDSAQALYGIPDVDPDAVGRTVGAHAHVRGGPTRAAGGGAHVIRGRVCR
ncbi:MAG: hypothetical protein LBR27_04305, partial [Bifidobacteriaceae bacterium]|nr:hypothetical protein [Bifidobacteriaceae bacterium]